MAGVNKVILLGNLGRDPELRYTQSGTAVCQLSIATSRTFTDRNNERREETEWHRVVVWGKQGENCAKYLKKGRQAYVEGRLQTRSYEDKEGIKRYSTEVVADVVQFIGGRDGGGGGGGYGGGGGGGGYGGSGGGGYGGGGGAQEPPPFGDNLGPQGGPPQGGPGDDDIPF